MFKLVYSMKGLTFEVNGSLASPQDFRGRNISFSSKLGLEFISFVMRQYSFI